MSATEAEKGCTSSGASGGFCSRESGGRGGGWLFFLLLVAGLLFLLVLFRFLSALGLGPVLLKQLLELPRGGSVFHDDADLAALVELESAQAHAADEHLLPVAQYGAKV